MPTVTAESEEEQSRNTTTTLVDPEAELRRQRAMYEQHLEEIGVSQDKDAERYVLCNFVYDTIWSLKKFIAGEHELEEGGVIATLIFEGVNVDVDNRPDYWKRNRSYVVECINLKRSNTSGAIKREFISKCVVHDVVCDSHLPLTNCWVTVYMTEWAIETYRDNREKGDVIPTLESLMVYRSQGDDQLFELWCDTFFRPGYGTSAFRDKALKKPLSEIMTVYDEAFIVATIDNNYERWMKEAEILSLGEVVNKKTLPRQKYTNDAASSKKYQGWSKDGIDFFNRTVNDLVQLRNTSASRLLEKNYMENINRDLQKKRTRKVNDVPATQAVDGLQDYLKVLFPNGVRNQVPVVGNQASGYSNKRHRISLGSENSSAGNDEDEYDEDDDVDGGGGGGDSRYPSFFDEEYVGQRRGV
jgi:hypothetical protein